MTDSVRSTALVLATANPNKVTELAELLAALSGDVEVRARPVWVAEVEETGTTFVANSDLKAQAVAAAVGEWALADDSGFEVDALDGAPGVRSARFGADLLAAGRFTQADLADRSERSASIGDAARSDDELNRRALAAMLSNLSPGSSDAARFRCALSLADPSGEVRLRTEGVAEGRVIVRSRGEAGFGYDPMFVPADGGGATFAEMSRSAKAAISHRGRALAELVDAMRAVNWPHL